MKKRLLLFYCLIFLNFAQAQINFVASQSKMPKVKTAFSQKTELVKAAFKKAGLSWPAKEIYIRSFKYDSELEVWGRNHRKDSFVLIKTYKICALSGTMGPKRMDGDFQVPEGFYYINRFRPNSKYHLALGINYPNISDQYLSDSIRPGSDIFIHGNCVTQGCIPIKNDSMDELYLMACYAHNSGQDFIPVHIFPIRFNVEKNIQFLNRSSHDELEYQLFIKKMKEVFFFFEQKKQIPLIAIDSNGEYILYANN